jgi:FAD/FMN-containing dehydrogenase
MEPLARIVGAENVQAPAPAWALRDATEWEGFSGAADALVLPGTAGEVAGVVEWAYEQDVPICVRGGGTGLAGGAVPDGGIVLALERLDRVREISPEDWTIEAEAGVTTSTVARLARENGLYFGVDPGAAEASHIGGNVATNAGGPHALRHGPMQRWIADLELVLAPGVVVRTGRGLPRDNAGLDLAGLMCGSEGTLGIVTAVRLRLLPAERPGRVLLAFYRDAAAGCGAAAGLLASGTVPAVLDFADGAALAAAGRSGAFALLVEDAAADDLGADHFEELDANEAWRWRAGLSHAAAAQRGGKLSDDVAVPVSRLAEMIEGVREIGASAGLAACSWGHAGDGIVHATFMVSPDEASRARAAAEEVFDLALELGGTLTGEHGIGRLKRHRLPDALDPAAHEAMRAVKRALDPKGLLNPGVR